MKSLFSIIKILVFVSLVSVCLHAQNRSKEKITLVTNKPAVYIAFQRIGLGGQINENDSKERVWLRLVNNTKWSIYIGAFEIKDSTEIGLFHEVESNRKILSDEDFPDVPMGYRSGHARSPDIELKSGKSINFSIPRNHLAENLKIKIDFSFDWEHLKELSDYQFSMPSYSVYFSSLDLKNSMKSQPK